MTVGILEKTLCGHSTQIFHPETSSSSLPLMKAGESHRAFVRVTTEPSFPSTVLFQKYSFYFHNCPSLDGKRCEHLMHEPCLLDTGLQRALLSLLHHHTSQLQRCEMASSFLDTTCNSTLLFDDTSASLRPSYLIYSSIYAMLVPVSLLDH